MLGGAPGAGITWAQIKQGTAHVIIHNGVTVTFPSDKFCRDHVDDNMITKITSIAAGPQQNIGGVIIGGERVSHAHVEGNRGVAYVWHNGNLTIKAYGDKVKGRGEKDSGGYDWHTK